MPPPSSPLGFRLTMSDNDVETKEKNISGREAYYIFTVASIVTVFIYIFFIHYLPPSISFFNGAGRIAIICIGNGSIIWMGYSVFRPRQPLFVEEIIPGMILNRKGDR